MGEGVQPTAPQESRLVRSQYRAQGSGASFKEIGSRLSFPTVSTAADSYPSVVQFRVLARLLQNPDFAKKIAETAHQAYETEVAGQKPTPLLNDRVDPAKQAVLVAQNLAPFYALDSLITKMWLEHKQSPVITLRQVVSGFFPEEGVTAPGMLANLAWKAGQPFRGIERIGRDAFAPFPFLEETELRKDPPLLQAVAKVVLETVEEHLATLYPAEVQERLFARTEKILEKVKQLAISRGEVHSEEQYAALRKTAQNMMFSHAGQTRKQGAPYYDHLLDVAEVLVDVFKVTNVQLYHIALKHDLREDQPIDFSLQRAYRRNKLQRDKATNHPELLAQKRKEFSLELLAIRMLSKVEEDELPAYAAGSGKRGQELTYDQIANPRKYFTDPNKPYPDAWIAGVQLVKLADILANTADLGGVLVARDGFTPGDKELGFPEKFMQKVMDKAIPLFVQQTRYLSPAVKGIFFGELQERLKREFVHPVPARSEGHAAFGQKLQQADGVLARLEHLNASLLGQDTLTD